jgi:hypothetical protein
MAVVQGVSANIKIVIKRLIHRSGGQLIHWGQKSPLLAGVKIEFCCESQENAGRSGPVSKRHWSTTTCGIPGSYGGQCTVCVPVAQA